MNLRLLLPFHLLIMACLPVFGADSSEPQNRLILPLAEQAPMLDGVIDDAEWQAASRVDGFGSDPRMARAYIMATRRHFYLAVWSQLPADGGLMTLVEKDTAAMIHDDSIEVWLDPGPLNQNGRRYQFMTNPLEHVFARMLGRGTVKNDTSWKADWQSVSKLHDDAWHCEMAIPVADLEPDRDITKGVWSIDLWRNWKRPWMQAFMGTTLVNVVAEQVPVISLHNRGERYKGDVHYALSVYNPGGTASTLKARMEAARDSMPSVVAEETLTVPAGETRELVLKENDTTAREWHLDVKVTDESGDVVRFEHGADWKAIGAYQWVTEYIELLPLDFRFAYHPSQNRLRIEADATNLPDDATLETLTAEVRKQGGETVMTVAFDNLVDGRQELWVTLPKLEGDYEIALQATGVNVPEDEVVQSFIRHRFPWEGMGYGITDKAFAPFTPLEVDGTTVRSVMREHAINGVGLWDSVVAEAQNTGAKKELLAAPMRYVVTLDGKNAAVQPGELKVLSRKENEVKARVPFRAGSLDAVADLTMEVDGMMRVDLTLNSSAGQSLDGLVLEIPMQAEHATMLHAMADGLRNTVNITLPEKQGEIWTAEQLLNRDIPKNFCTLALLASEARGLTWFTANDYNWRWNPETPNLTIERDGDAVVMRVHLVNLPIVIDEPRTLTFGLQAAPVKPRQHKNRFRRFREDWTWVLTSINWGSYTAAFSAYPPMRDTLVWEKLAKANEHGPLSEAEMQEVFDRYLPYVGSFGVEWRGEPQAEWWERVMRHNLGKSTRYDKKMIFYWNRACHLLEEEFLTFQDEWYLSDWRVDFKQIGRENNQQILIVPTDDFMDFHIYWYDKSFDLARNHGVYWDNMFLQGSYNTEHTFAYELPDGSIRPSTGIWGLRELVKRTFNHMCIRGMEPLTYPHMTSTVILPVYGFATKQLDLEWKMSEGPFQTRHVIEYTRMATSGELTGVWPTVLNARDFEKKDPYLIPRSFTGCLLVHDVYHPCGEAGGSLLRPVVEMLRDPRTKVMRYWDEVDPAPVSGGHPEVYWIAHYIPGEKALITFVNYAPTPVFWQGQVRPESFGFDANATIQDAFSMEDKFPELPEGVRFRILGYDATMLEILPDDGQ